MDILSECQTIFEDIIALRRKLHTIPEVGNTEFKTTQLIIETLEPLGYKIERPLQTGCIATLYGQGKQTVAYRSDIDALPIQEETGLSFASCNGNMHACGHDMHMAGLLGAAILLAKHRDDLQGNVKLIFQPDEEQDGGAKRILDTGILDDVSMIFGCHVNPDLPTGVIGLCKGKFYASAGKFDIVVEGKSSHGAEPENGIDAIQAASLLATRFQRLNGIYHNHRCVVSVGTFHGGSVRNIICDTVTMSGIIRSMSVSVRDEVMVRMKDIIQEVEIQTGCHVNANIYAGYPGVENHDSGYQVVKESAIQLFGKEKVKEDISYTMTTEDFGEYLLQIPGCFYHVGIQSPYPLHNGKMNPDENALLSMSSLTYQLLVNSLLQLR